MRRSSGDLRPGLEQQDCRQVALDPEEPGAVPGRSRGHRGQASRREGLWDLFSEHPRTPQCLGPDVGLSHHPGSPLQGHLAWACQHRAQGPSLFPWDRGACWAAQGQPHEGPVSFQAQRFESQRVCCCLCRGPRESFPTAGGAPNSATPHPRSVPLCPHLLLPSCSVHTLQTGGWALFNFSRALSSRLEESRTLMSCLVLQLTLPGVPLSWSLVPRTRSIMHLRARALESDSEAGQLFWVCGPRSPLPGPPSPSWIRMVPAPSQVVVSIRRVHGCKTLGAGEG